MDSHYPEDLISAARLLLDIGPGPVEVAALPNGACLAPAAAERARDLLVLATMAGVRLTALHGFGAAPLRYLAVRVQRAATSVGLRIDLDETVVVLGVAVEASGALPLLQSLPVGLALRLQSRALGGLLLVLADLLGCGALAALQTVDDEAERRPSRM